MYYVITYEARGLLGYGIVERKRWGSAQPYLSVLGEDRKVLPFSFTFCINRLI